MMDSPRAVRFIAEVDTSDGSHESIRFWAICDTPGGVPDEVTLRVAHIHDPASERSVGPTVDAIVAALESWCIEHGAKLLEDPSAQLEPRLTGAEPPDRHLDSEVQATVVDAYRRSRSDLQSLANRFALGTADNAKTALERSGISPHADDVEIPATDTQKRKYETFEQSPLRSNAVELIQSIVSVNDLQLDRIGEDWGIIVAPTPGIVARVNVGMRTVVELDREGLVYLYMLGSRSDLVDVSDSVAEGPGFKPLPDSYCLVAKVGDDVTVLLGNPGVLAQHRALVAHGYRRLLNSKWHNPLTRDLVDPSSDEI